MSVQDSGPGKNEGGKTDGGKTDGGQNNGGHGNEGQEDRHPRTDLKIERPVRLAPSRAFELITRPEHLVGWWGPKGVTLGAHQLDFTRLGPWSSVMTEPEAGWHRVSGEVLSISEGEAVEISWAWHDRETDVRGHESRVRLAVRDDGAGCTILTMQQSGLADAESARLHHEGWSSSLGRIDAMITPPGPIP